ncbi:MAG: hypothetical protein PQJ45_04940 [Sphaerochaetaceae bacterium]|nr:hypothetical protein [Sphaerochaetaceae bacterium]MDC7237101.1 hypothetical protein [Sphaerochaetaceae bacterium]
MKRGFIILILVFSSSPLLIASNFSLSIALALDSENYQAYLDSDKASSLVRNINDYQFSEFEKNNLEFISSLCKYYLPQLEMKNYFIDELKSNKAKAYKKNLNTNFTTSIQRYSNSPSDSALNTINTSKSKLLDINEDETSLEINETYQFEVTQIENNAIVGLILENQNSLLVTNLLNKYNTNAFLLVSNPEINGIQRLRIEYLDQNIRQTIYDRILETKNVSDYEKDILASLVTYFNNEYSILSINNKSQSTKIEDIISISKEKLEETEKENYPNIYIREKDKKTLNINNNFVVLKKGIHYFKVYDSYNSYIEKINLINDYNELDLELKEATVASINIFSNVGSLNFTLNGMYLNDSVALNLVDEKIPFYLEATKEGFSTYTIQNLSQFDSLDIILKPEWTINTTAIAKSQEDFYSSLLTYVLIRLTTLSINNVNDAFGNSDIEPTLDILSTAVQSLSTINVINKLISYIKLATT